MEGERDGRGREGERRGKGEEGEGREGGLCSSNISFKKALLCLYLAPFLRYSESNNDATLKSGLGVVLSDPEII